MIIEVCKLQIYKNHSSQLKKNKKLCEQTGKATLRNTTQEITEIIIRPLRDGERESSKDVSFYRVHKRGREVYFKLEIFT